MEEYNDDELMQQGDPVGQLQEDIGNLADHVHSLEVKFDKLQSTHAKTLEKLSENMQKVSESMSVIAGSIDDEETRKEKVAEEVRSIIDGVNAKGVEITEDSKKSIAQLNEITGILPSTLEDLTKVKDEFVSAAASVPKEIKQTFTMTDKAQKSIDNLSDAVNNIDGGLFEEAVSKGVKTAFEKSNQDVEGIIKENFNELKKKLDDGNGSGMYLTFRQWISCSIALSLFCCLAMLGVYRYVQEDKSVLWICLLILSGLVFYWCAYGVERAINSYRNRNHRTY